MGIPYESTKRSTVVISYLMKSAEWQGASGYIDLLGGSTWPTALHHTVITISNRNPLLHLLRLLGYSTCEETMMTRTEPNQALRTSTTSLFTGNLVVGLVLISGVVTGPA